MRAIHLAVLIGLFAAAGVLYAMTRSGSSKAKTPERAAKRSDQRDTSEPPNTNATPPERRTEKGAGAGTSTGDDDDVAAERDSFERVGKTGNRVRDYRGTGAPIRDPDAPINRPFKTKRIEATVVAKMARELRRVAESCREDHAGEVKAGARAQPRPTFSIRDGQLTVTSVEIALTDIEENGSFRSCLESAALGLVVEAPNHREIDKDTMAVPITFK